MLIQKGDVINKTWVPLDTWSTDRVAKILDYVEEVKKCDKQKALTVLTNGRSRIFIGKVA